MHLRDFQASLSPLGIAPFSGRCMECGNTLKPTDIDHSFCNTCWDNIMRHTFVEYENGLCDICDMTEGEGSHAKAGSSGTEG